MITSPLLQWVFTAVFVAIAGYLVWRLIADRGRPVQFIGGVFHLLMALVMVAMAWPWWRTLPWLPQLVLFAVSTLWFVAVAIAQRLGRFEPAQLGCHPAWHQAVHAVMMGSMTWMVAVMPPGGHHMMSNAAMLIGLVFTIGLVVGALLLAIDAVRANGRAGHGRLEALVMVAMLMGMAVMNTTMF